MKTSIALSNTTVALLLALTLPLVVTTRAMAQSEQYPVKPVRLIVPGPPASVTDVRARWIVEQIAPTFGQPIIIENRPGAGGNIAAELVTKSTADGYTIALIHQGMVAINPHVYAKLGYDALNDFAPITTIARNPLVLAVHPDVPASTVAELIALAKSKPGKLFYGSPGNGTPPHLATELFKLLAGINVVHVPYKGGAPALADLMAGQLTFTIEGPAIQLQQVKAGRLRALGISAAQRPAGLPDLPTIAESGLSGYEYVAWAGLAAPAGTPRAAIDKWQQEVARALQTPKAREFLAAQGAEGGGEPPEQLNAFIRAEHAKWGKVVREAGIKAD